VSHIEEKDHPELAAEIAKIKGGRARLIDVSKLLHAPAQALSAVPCRGSKMSCGCRA
jgi:hypothetical protein